MKNYFFIIISLCFYQFAGFVFFSFDSSKIIETPIPQIKYNMKNTAIHVYI